MDIGIIISHVILIFIICLSIFICRDYKKMLEQSNKDFYEMHKLVDYYRDKYEKQRDHNRYLMLLNDMKEKNKS